MAKSSFLGGWQILFTPTMFLPFIIGAVALGVLGNATYQFLTNLLGNENYVMVVIAIISILIIIIMVRFITYLLNRNQDESVINKSSPQKRKGLILLVSSTPTCAKAIEYHKEILSTCWLICSDSSSKKEAEEIESLFSDQIITFKRETISDSEVYDPIILKDKIEKIYKNLPEFFTEKDVILDFTGMTSIASVGAVLANLSGNRPIQYTPAVYDLSLKAKRPLNPIEIKFDWVNSISVK